MRKFSPTRTITQKNLENVPGNKPGVYRIKNTPGDILYIGKAKGGRLDDRIAEHKGEIKGGTRFQYRTTPNKEAAERLEKREIRRYNPSFNKDR
ncbi:MAG: GIY-YIG nuclease family protein [Atribacterota bacterium]|nr:GIY-YIG nuclease family protein [Atribacterota bacterium]